MDDETPPATKSPPAKKRGRKRKSDFTLDDFEVDSFLPVVETVSRSGRRVKQINYFDMVNRDEFDDGHYVAPKKKESPVKVGEKKRGRPRKIQPPPETEPEPTLNNGTEVPEVENDTPEKSSENGAEKIELDTSPETPGADEKSQTLRNGVGSLCSDMNTNFGFLENGGEKMELDTSPETPAANETSRTLRSGVDSSCNDMNSIKKYNKTGATVKMLNELFTAYLADYLSDIKNEKHISFGREDMKKCKGITVAGEASDEVVVKTEEVINPNDVVCAVCNSSMAKTLWTHHKYRYHNNLTWKVGEQPLDFTDQKKMLAILNKLYKDKKQYFCELCGLSKRSVHGYFSHYIGCQKSEKDLDSVKAECNICGRKVLIVSMPSHMKVHTEKPESVEKKEVKEEKESGRRSAKKKAMEMIKEVTSVENEHVTTNLEFGTEEFAMNVLMSELENEGQIKCKYQYCEFESDVLEDVTKHFSECDKKPNEGFACRLCLYTRDNVDEVVSHMAEVHDIENVEEYNSLQSEKKPLGNYFSFEIPSFISRSGGIKQKLLFQYAFKWTYQFHEENCDSELFKDISCSRTEWPILPFEMALKYLPKLDQSCDVAQLQVSSFTLSCLKQTFEFKKYDLFDFERHPDGKCTIFCGGPVTSFAWLPTSFRKTDEDQKIAVAVINTPDTDYLINDNYAEPCLIQIWSLGCLKNKNQPQYEPHLELGIAFDHGPIWHLEWCPSGCYDDVTLGRMGLLAIAGSDRVVYIYSVPLVNRHNNKNGLFYKPKPVMKLYLERPELTKTFLGGLKYHPTKISWTKAAGHDHIAVAYTNGFVALFNINTESVMLNTKDTADVTCIFPKKSFQAHLHTVTGLTLYHLCGGAKYLLTSSLDREICVFDLTGSSSPIWRSKKYVISDAHWMTHWLSILIGTDEASTTSHLSTSLRQVHDHMSDSRMLNLLGSTSTITSITSSDWLNAIIQCNAVGETLGLTVHELIHSSEQNKTLKKKRMLFGYVKKVEKLKSPEERFKDETTKKKVLIENNKLQRSNGMKLTNISSHLAPEMFNNEPIFYHEAQEKYALVFCDNVMKTYSDFTETAMNQLSPLSKVCGIVQPNLYPLTQINKVSFNPNRQASLFYATGYQAGFLRISYMEFLEGDPQIN